MTSARSSRKPSSTASSRSVLNRVPLSWTATLRVPLACSPSMSRQRLLQRAPRCGTPGRCGPWSPAAPCGSRATRSPSGRRRAGASSMSTMAASGSSGSSTSGAVARVLGGGDAGAPSEHVDVEQRVGAEAVGAVHGHAGDLAGGVQARDDVVVVAQHLGLDVGRHAAHRVVRGRVDRHRLGVRLDAKVGARELGDVRELRVDVRGLEVGQVEQHVVLVRAAAAALAHLVGHGTGATMSRGARSLMVGA